MPASRAYSARSADEALRVLAQQPIDLMLTDYNMPEMSGLELAQQLARLQPALPVVITSGYLADELREQAERAGVRARASSMSATRGAMPGFCPAATAA